jgi:uncharacterized delta-60 repeat protein
MNVQLLRSVRCALRAAPAAALATSFACPTALADPGDLVPDFADVGRFVAPDDFNGPAFSLDAQDDDFVLAGGETFYFYWYDRVTQGFASRLSGDGTLDPTFDAPDLAGLMVVETAMQTDGKVVGIGVRDQATLVFRLERDGALDLSFGDAGERAIVGLDGLGSLALDPGGTIVIAGWFASNLRVLRLLANGDPDTTFGTDGVFTAPDEVGDGDATTVPRILIADGGGYRVTDSDVDASSVPRCRVLALTAGGAIDETFGDQGYAGLTPSDVAGYCYAMAERPDGELLVAGSQSGLPVIVRLVASGAVDATFSTDALQATEMSSPAEIAIDPATEAITVAGYGSGDAAGFPVVRVNGDGSVDTSFGIDGTTWVDLPNSSGAVPFVGDVDLAANGDVLIAGGSLPNYFSGVPFVVRLSSGDGGDSPGVIGLRNPDVQATEGGDKVVTVRRMGGKTGSVSVAWEARTSDVGPFFTASDDDFTATSGTLTWADGDTTDKTFAVQIAPDAGSAEEEELFAVELSDVQGGAGLGTDLATMRIASDSTSAGLFSVEYGSAEVAEGEGFIQVYVTRTYSWTGAATVNVTAVSDSATAGDDFQAEPITVSWADGESDWKPVDIPVVDDSLDESNETFTVQLTDATGGAVIGPRSSLSLSIVDNDPLPGGGGNGNNDDGGDGGGGRVGWLSLLLLGMTRWLRRRSTTTG